MTLQTSARADRLNIISGCRAANSDSRHQWRVIMANCLRYHASAHDTADACLLAIAINPNPNPSP